MGPIWDRSLYKSLIKSSTIAKKLTDSRIQKPLPPKSAYKVIDKARVISLAALQHTFSMFSTIIYMLRISPLAFEYVPARNRRTPTAITKTFFQRRHFRYPRPGCSHTTRRSMIAGKMKPMLDRQNAPSWKEKFVDYDYVCFFS